MYIALLIIYSFLLLFISCNMMVKRKIPYFFVCTVVIILICTITFFYSPDGTDDLSRLNVWIHEIQTNSLSKETIINAQFDILWLEKIYFQFIALFTFKNALSIISIALEMFIIFVIYKKMSLDLRLNTRYLMIALLFFLFTWDYMNAISGVRYPLLCAPLFAVLYYDLVKKKNIFICFSAYIILCFFHIGALVILILRTISLLCKTSRLRYLLYAALLLHYFVLDGLVGLVEFMPSSGLKSIVTGKIISMFWKMDTLGFMRRIFIKLPLAIVLFYMLIIFFKYYQHQYKQYCNYANFLGITLSFGIGSLYYYDLFMRMTTFVYIAFIPLYWIFHIEAQKRTTKDTLYQRFHTRLSLYLANLCLLISFCYLLFIQYTHLAEAIFLG